MADALNPRQRQIIEFLREHAGTHAYPPTVREIGLAVGLSSSSTVQNHLNSLEAKGYIRRDPTKSRTVEVVGHEPASSRRAPPPAGQNQPDPAGARGLPPPHPHKAAPRGGGRPGAGLEPQRAAGAHP